MAWNTFYGRSIPVHHLSHQHLSNIAWYYELVVKSRIPHEVDERLTLEFGNLRLPYHPQLSFIEEIDFLINSGYTSGNLNAPIIVDGRWIGSLKYD